MCVQSGTDMPRTYVILSTDGTDAMREALAEALAGVPYELVTAASGPEVLVRAHEARPDLILLDLELPVVGGLRVLELLGADTGTAAIPVVALDSAGGDAEAARALAAGAAFYLQKPVPADEARAVIRRLLVP